MFRLHPFFIVSAVASLGCAGTISNVPAHAIVHGDRESAPSPVTEAKNLPSAVATPSGVFEREAFVRAVLRQNPSVEAARSAYRAAAARVRAAGAFDDPTADIGVAPLAIGASHVPLGYEVGISQKVPWFGKRSLESSAAAAEAEAARDDVEGVKRDLALTAVGLYDRYFVATRSLEINAAHVRLMRTLRASATAAFESGRGSAQDPLQAESELAHLERDGVELASQRDILVAQINDLLHREPDVPIPPPPVELALPAERHGDVEQRRTDEGVTRPDVAAARARARAQGARADRAARQAYPDLTLSTSYNSMWDTPEHRWMVGIGFNLPIQSGTRTAMVEEATAMRAEFETEARRLESAARTEAYVSRKELQESLLVLGVFEERLLPTARAQIDAANAAFAASRSSFTAVIEAERNLRTTELDYQAARAECDHRLAELEHALGRVPGLAPKESAHGR